MEGRTMKLAKILLIFPVLPMFFLLGACHADPFQAEPTIPYESTSGYADRMFELRSATEKVFLIQAGVVFERKKESETLLLVAKIDRFNEIITATALTPTGAKIFEFSSRRRSVMSYFMFPVFERFSGYRFEDSKHIQTAFVSIYFDDTPPKGAVPELKSGAWFVRVENGPSSCTEYVFAGSPSHLVSKTFYENGSRVRQVRYYKYLPVADSDTEFPGEIVYEDFTHEYRLIFRTRDIQQVN